MVLAAFHRAGALAVNAAVQHAETPVNMLALPFITTEVRNNKTAKQQKYETTKVKTTKVRNNESAKVRDNESAKQRKCETTKMRNNESAKQRKCGTTKVRNCEKRHRGIWLGREQSESVSHDLSF